MMKPLYLELHEKLMKLQRLTHRHFIKAHARKGPMGNPIRGQGRVLAMLKIQPNISTKDLSYLLGIRQQSLNELLTKLEKSDYITRVVSEEDKRVMLVCLTDKGKSEQPKPIEMDNIFTCLNDDEINNFIGYLDRIIESLEEKQEVMDEDFEQRMQEIRSKLGDEEFEQFMAMRGSYSRHLRKKRRKDGDKHDEIDSSSATNISE